MKPYESNKYGPIGSDRGKMDFEAVPIPVTRWKRGRHGVLPKTEGMSKLINCTPVEAPAIPPKVGPEGFKTPALRTVVPYMKTPEKGDLLGWLKFADFQTSLAFGGEQRFTIDAVIEPMLEEPIVPRGTSQVVIETQATHPTYHSVACGSGIPAKPKIPKYYAKA